MQNKDMALKFAGGVFLVVAIIHLLRLLSKTQIYVGGYYVRLLFSLAGFIAALLAALWMFSAGKKK